MGKFGGVYGASTPKMPVAAFEAAFASWLSGPTASPELLDAVWDYLFRADFVNSVIDRWQARGGQASDIRLACNPPSEPSLSEIPDGLGDWLERELEEAQRSLV